MMAKWIKPGLLLVLIISLVWFFTRLISGLPLAEMLQRLAALAWWQWLLWISLNLLLLAVANLRWWLLLRQLAPFDFFPLLWIRQAGQLVNMLTPGPHVGGEPLQLYWLARRQLPLGKGLVALGVDRLLELGINLSVLVLGLVLLLNSRFSELTLPALLAKSWLLLLLLLVPLAWRYRRWPLARLAQMLATWRKHPRLAPYINHIDDGLDKGLVAHGKALLGDVRLLLTGIGLSLGGWVLLLSELALLLAMVGVQLSLGDFVALAVALRLSQFAPVPAGLGALEIAVFGACSLLEIPKEAAFGLVLLMRCRDLGLIIGGLACLHWVQRQPLRLAPVQSSI